VLYFDEPTGSVNTQSPSPNTEQHRLLYLKMRKNKRAANREARKQKLPKKHDEMLCYVALNYSKFYTRHVSMRQAVFVVFARAFSLLERNWEDCGKETPLKSRVHMGNQLLHMAVVTKYFHLYSEIWFFICVFHTLIGMEGCHMRKPLAF